MLISCSQWREIAKTPPIEDYVLCFCLSIDRTKLDIALDIAKKRQKRLVVVGHKVIGYENVMFVDDAGPLEWLGWMDNAEFIFTDSFHGTAFAVNLSKQFSVFISDSSKASRITNLLQNMDLNRNIDNRNNE